MARVISKFSAAGQKCREDSTETREPVDVSRIGLMSRMATSYDDRDIGSDMDALAVMNDDILPESSSPGDTRYQRNVSVACVVSKRKTNQSKQFWLFRYQVQNIRHPIDKDAQKAVSARLTALHRLVRFDSTAIHDINVLQVIIELLERTSELRQDNHRLRKRSQRLMKRLSGTIYAHRRWLAHVR